MIPIAEHVFMRFSSLPSFEHDCFSTNTLSAKRPLGWLHRSCLHMFKSSFMPEKKALLIFEVSKDLTKRV